MSQQLLAAVAQASGSVVSWLLAAVALGTVLAALTWLVSRLVPARLSPALHAVLWTLVLLKFLLPVGPQWSGSLSSLCGTLLGGSPAARGSADQSDLGPPLPFLLGGAHLASPDRTQAAVAATWAPAAAGLYLAAVTLVLGRRLVRYRLFAAHLRALPEAGRETLGIVHALSRGLGLRRPPSVRLTDTLPAPFISGLFRPVLVLPRLPLVRPHELETVVVHELTHLRRGDLVVRCLQWLAGALFFFWPVVAWVNRNLDTAREQACDRWALRHGQLSAAEYARCLLRAVRAGCAPRLLHDPACMAGRVSDIERRIDMILKTPSNPATLPRVQLLSAVLILAWGAFVLTGAVDARGQQELTDDSISAHAATIVGRIAAYPSADVDGDGAISFEERNAFLVALLLEEPEANLQCFPYSGPFRGSELDVKAAYDVVRGLTYRIAFEHEAKTALVKAKEEGAPDAQLRELKAKLHLLDLQGTEVVLEAQDALLDRFTVEPSRDLVAKIQQQLATAKVVVKNREELRLKSDQLRFKIQQLEAEGRPDEAAKLREALAKIEAMSGAQ